MADTNDVITLTEAKTVLKITHTGQDTILAQYVTFVSTLLDDNCGPIVKRTDTNTVYPANPTTIQLTSPIHAVNTVTDSGTSLTTSDYRLTERASGTGNYTGTIRRTLGQWGGGPVVVNATFGRYDNTASVAPHFKVAAYDILRNMWRAEEISVGQVGDFDVPFQTFPAAYAIPNAARDALGDDWQGVKNSAHTGVMFG